MSMVVRNNLSAINTLNMLNRNHSALAKSIQTVSSGMRIYGAKDDASGYAISERMRVQIRSLNQDNNNTQNGHSMMKVAEGAVQSTVDILKTLKEKVINAANDTNTDADRQQIQKELNQSIDQINDNALVTYNGKYLLNGSKNAKGDGTFTALTNNSLHDTTKATTSLVNLKDRSGRSLNIQTGDQVTVSYVQEGKTYSTTFAVTSGMSLTTVLKKAEAIDPGDTFANVLNPSVIAVNGESDMQSIIDQRTREKNAAKEAMDQAQAAVTLANTAYTTAKRNQSNYSTAVSEVTEAYGTFTTYFEAQDKTVLSGVDLNPSDNNWNKTLTEYATWQNTGTGRSDFLATYGNPRNVTGDNLPRLLTGSSSLAPAEPGYAAAVNVQKYFKEYKDAYGALVDNYSETAAADLQTAVTTAEGALRLAERKLKDKTQEYNEAVEALANVSAPTILDGTKIGLDYFGNLVSTPDEGSALTITAYNRGNSGQIAGFTISVTDSQGNIKKSVNAVLDAWNESIRAENGSEEDFALILQTGTKANQAIKIRMTDMRAHALGLIGSDGTTLNVSNQKNANAAINVLDNALQKALDQQTTIGAIESRLEYTSTNLVTAAENVTASESTLRDADMAKAMTEYTKNNILMQASQAMLAQANQSNNQVLSLLR